MFILLAGLAIARTSIASAIPTFLESSAQNHTLSKRDPCDGVNAATVLYHEYHADECPPKLTMNDDGTCPGQDAYTNDCAAFCQVRTNFFYGQEVPIENSYCHGVTCSISETVTRTITKSASVNANFEWGFKFGVTGGFTFADATANARSFTVVLHQGECGYFTIIPEFKETCGTMTQAEWSDPPDGLCAPNSNTYPNVCALEQWKYDDGTVRSQTVFVRVDPATLEPLGPEFQDPAYNQPGVALPRAQYDILASHWKYIAEGQTYPPASSPQCGTFGYTMPHDDVQTCNLYLDAADSGQCCSNGANGSKNICAVNGNAVDLHGQDGDGNPLCIDCARAANYLAGIEGACNQDGLVGGTQDIVEVPGLTIQI